MILKQILKVTRRNLQLLNCKRRLGNMIGYEFDNYPSIDDRLERAQDTNTPRILLIVSLRDSHVLRYHSKAKSEGSGVWLKELRQSRFAHFQVRRL